MQPQHFSRQMKRQFLSETQKPLPAEYDRLLRQVLSLSDTAAKFTLPERGRLLDDPELRAIDEADQLRLPYPVCALEYSFPRFSGDTSCSKRVLLMVEQSEGLICFPVVYWDQGERFIAMKPFGLHHGNHIDRGAGRDGMPAVLLAFDGTEEEGKDRHQDALVALSFLNALSCSNVRIEHQPARGQGKKAGQALPFDSYHTLTIEPASSAGRSSSSSQAHRSPREHLRRGHIRRYESGLKVWVNAAVVNPGIGGRIFKDYRFQPTAPRSTASIHH